MAELGRDAVRAVVFDIGNVLIRWQPEEYYDRVIGQERRRALFDAVDLHGMNQDVDDGAPFRETIYAMADAHPDWADDIRRWHDEWHLLAQPVIEHTVTLYRALIAQGTPVFILSNIGDATFDVATDHFPFLSEADRAFVSGKLKLSKPDPAIYAAVEAESGIAPEHLLFADDKPENIAAAEARGWKAHRFEGPEGWGRRLVAEGLLPAGTGM